jgi:hypothetical protein
MLEVLDHSGLPEDELADLRRGLAEVRTLEDAVRWGLGASPPHEIVEVVTQDEYTHDVILHWSGEAYLTFDAT